MDHSLEILPEATTRQVREWFVAYRKDTYPRFGEGSLPCYSYREFKAKALERVRLNHELAELYARHPQLSQAPAEDRAKMVHLEVQSSQLEHELCMS
ncbi:hypothetical protein D3C86_1046770 [compost metagenome]